MPRVKVWLDDGAYMPTRGHDTDAGLDLRAKSDEYVYSKDSFVFDTGVHLLIPEGWCGLLVSKSGLNVCQSVQTTGLIDANYTGSIKVRVYNHRDEGISINAGDKITQIVFLQIGVPTLELDVVQESGLRGDGAYGSTGK